ncbi:hypothetical protein BDR07DRAFT_1414225 [Suillus spraguei]|nr:hypothetical protein BDR07DRAFT_1414225 [Suillus spraguei]
MSVILMVMAIRCLVGLNRSLYAFRWQTLFQRFLLQKCQSSLYMQVAKFSRPLQIRNLSSTCTSSNAFFLPYPLLCPTTCFSFWAMCTFLAGRFVTGLPLTSAVSKNFQAQVDQQLE